MLLLQFLRLLIYLPISLFCSLRLIFLNKFILVDLDYTLCKNEVSQMSIEKFNYKNLDIEINSDIKERVIQHNIEGYKTIIFSSRGIRAYFFSKEWLLKNEINYNAFFHLGLTSLKLIPILMSIIFLKNFILIDDLSDIKDGKLVKSFIYSHVETLSNKNFFKWEDPQKKI